MSLVPELIHARRYSVHRVFLQWRVAGITSATPSMTFTIERSPTGVGDWEPVASGVTSALYVDDLVGNAQEINILSEHRTLYYRVGVAGPDAGAGTIWSAPMDLYGSTVPATVGHRQDGILVQHNYAQSPAPGGPFYPGQPRHREIIRIADLRARKQAVYLERFVGERTAIFKRRRFGQRCTSCWSSHAKAAVFGKCSECYGTGWAGGYHTPVITSVRVRNAPGQQQLTPGGRTSVSMTMANLGPYPHLEQDDLLVDLGTDNRWRVDQADPRVLRGYRYKQRVTVEELPRSGVEFRLQIPEALEHVLVIDAPTV